MDKLYFTGECHKITLKDILNGYGQPISEEQAWALCYQCCCKLRHLVCGARQVPLLQDVDNIFIHEDGAMSFSSYFGTWDSNHFESKVIEQLGQILYTALDWGVSSDLERVLSEPLNTLLCTMLGLDTPATDPTMNFQYTFTLNGILKVCAERLFPPSEASVHYRTVCRVLFAEHKEFHKILISIEQSKQSLKLLEAEDLLGKDSVQLYENWGDLWRHVIGELRVGIRLSNAKERSYVRLPIEYKLSPHELLMKDIRCRRYTLRKVKDCEKNKINLTPDNFIVDFIRSQPLRPASERKLRERSQEEPSLHELLMTEIKSATKLRPFSRHQDGYSEQGACSEKINWQSELISEASNSKLSDIRSFSSDLMFVPVLTSSQDDLKMSGFMCHDKPNSFTHRCSSSFEGSFQNPDYCPQASKKFGNPKVHSTTIEELVVYRRSTVKAEILDFLQSYRFSGNQVCFSCHKKRLFFTWPYTCKMCERVNCLECSVEMLMPFKQCMHLPVSFFKTLVLTKEDDPVCQEHAIQMFYRETLNWDCSKIPLVFEHQDIAENVSSIKSSMVDWMCIDICTKCEEYFLDAIDQSKHIELSSGRLKMRSASLS
ncbi:protein spire homolog 1-like [Pelodytes ibericus]